LDANIFDWDCKIVITGAAGLVGQNLTILLRERGCREIIAIDKHASNLALLQKLNPDVRTVLADLAVPGEWQDAFDGADVAIMLHAQIGGKEPQVFVRNNLTATGQVLDAIQKHQVGFTVHVSSSVVNSVADDDYTNTKKQQEAMFRERGVAGCVLRPTLMYGWFDPKHFGWLARFMEKAPVFPIPGHGRYMRQPLYNRDFCRAVLWCVQHRPAGATYDLVGQDRIDYIDIIREIRKVRQLRTPIVRIPFGLFSLLLKIYSLFSANPPFTASQLKALAAGDDFSGVDIQSTFGFVPTPFTVGVRETFCDPLYSGQLVARS
jgi:nucleoside-diphosphate-sugar epimerase